MCGSNTIKANVRPTLTEALFGRPPAQAARVQRIHLMRGQTHVCRAQGQILCVGSGVAWVTMGGRDYVVPAGHRLALTTTRELVVISSLKGQALVCRLG